MAQVKEELLNAVKEAQASMQSIQMELGAIALAELRKEALMAAYKEQQANIQKTTEAIREEYGDGSVNLETGEFTAEEKAQMDVVK